MRYLLTVALQQWYLLTAALQLWYLLTVVLLLAAGWKARTPLGRNAFEGEGRS